MTEPNVIYARAVARESGGAGPQPAAQPAKNDWSDWEKWAQTIHDRVNDHHQRIATLETELGGARDAFNEIAKATKKLFDHYERRIAALEKRPVSREIRHLRDSNGMITGSVALAEPNGGRNG